jgi:hypothetical protein
MDKLTERGIFGPMIEAIAEEGRKLERELAAMTAHDAWEHGQWEKMVSHGVGLQNRLQEMTTLAETAERERDALAKENEWHPASVRPELHEHVMTIDSMGQLHIDFWYPTENRFWSERDGDDDEKITHWRELPQPPKGEAT